VSVLSIEQAQKIAREAPEMRKELVVRIQHALELGTLTLDSRLVAEKLLGIEIDDVCYAA
jgi:anti-sigma28 factor (negative regulator of flagellin synthesis)